VRAPLNVRVLLRYEREGVERQCHCRSFDVSEGGIGLMSPDELELDRVVELELWLPETEAPLQLRAVIRSKVGFRLGCEFVDPTSKQKAEIIRYKSTLRLPVSPS
jgi:hypothetical protein